MTERDEILEALKEKDAQYRANPLAFWHLPKRASDASSMMRANPTQLAFHRSPAKSRWFISGNRRGKTECVAHEIAYFLAHCHPFRKTPERPLAWRWYTVDKEKIQQILLPKLIGCLPPSIVDKGRGRGFNTNSGLFKCRCKYGGWHQVFMGTYGQEAIAAEGGKYDGMGYDEPPPNQLYQANQIRRVDLNADELAALTPLQDEIPWDVSWISTDIEAHADGKKIAVFRCLENENLDHLDAEAWDNAVSNLSSDQIAVRVRGEFAFMKGVIYKEFRPDTHLCDPFDVRARVEARRGMVYVGIDHGDYKNTAATFHYVEGDGENMRDWIFGEYFDGVGRKVYENCAAIRAKLGSLPVAAWFIDPSVWYPDETTGTTMGEEYFKAGCPAVPSNNDIPQGEEAVKVMLTVPRDATGRCWRDDPQIRPPRLMLFNEGCELTEQALLRYSTRTSRSRLDEPADLKRSNRYKHLPDSMRYVLVMSPSGVSRESHVNRTREPRTAMPMALIAPARHTIDQPSPLRFRRAM
jgi:hypothetical protein